MIAASYSDVRACRHFFSRVTVPTASPTNLGPVLIVEGSPAARQRLRSELVPRHLLTLAQTVTIARTRTEEALPAAAVVTIDGENPSQIELVQWLAAQRVPVLAVINDDAQRRRLLASGASVALTRPPEHDEPGQARHAARVAAWVDAVVVDTRDSTRLRCSVLPRHSLSPSSKAPRSGRVGPSQLLRSRQPGQPASASVAPSVHLPAARPVSFDVTGTVFCIGISTGGPEALETIFRQLPATMPPIVIVQHMPPGFTANLARRLHSVSAMTVREASDEETLHTGLALLAPGGLHLRLRRQGFHVVAELSDAPPVGRHRPSVDVLFESAAEVLGPLGIGVVMTGMGDDGTRGLLAMKARGALTVAQDALGCTVFGMPQRAIASGAVDYVVPLDAMARRLVELAQIRDVASLP